jgi:hypothetical protein
LASRSTVGSISLSLSRSLAKKRRPHAIRRSAVDSSASRLRSRFRRSGRAGAPTRGAGTSRRGIQDARGGGVISPAFAALPGEAGGAGRGRSRGILGFRISPRIRGRVRLTRRSAAVVFRVRSGSPDVNLRCCGDSRRGEEKRNHQPGAVILLVQARDALGWRWDFLTALRSRCPNIPGDGAMSSLNLLRSVPSEQAGTSKSTIWRAIKASRLSARAGGLKE